MDKYMNTWVCVPLYVHLDNVDKGAISVAFNFSVVCLFYVCSLLDVMKNLSPPKELSS